MSNNAAWLCVTTSETYSWGMSHILKPSSTPHHCHENHMIEEAAGDLMTLWPEPTTWTQLINLWLLDFSFNQTTPHAYTHMSSAICLASPSPPARETSLLTHNQLLNVLDHMFILWCATATPEPSNDWEENRSNSERLTVATSPFITRKAF